MERAISVEEKIRRAEEIYNRRRENQYKTSNARVRVDSTNTQENSRTNKRLKKMIVQIIACLLIYLIFYYIINNNYIFSEDFKKKCEEILAYDISFNEMYQNILSTMTVIKEEYQSIPENKEENIQNNNEENTEQTNQEQQEQQEQNNQIRNQEESENNENNQNSEGETEENKQAQLNQEENIGGETEEVAHEEEIHEEKELTEEEQMKKDAEDIKSKVNFIKPLNGTITSVFGWRNPTVETVSKYHKGIDIAANEGTNIISATNGTVILASSEGAFGNHLKIQIEDITITYAHCQSLEVEQGASITQGQIIAKVGSTGNSTGPHLHFEIKKEDRYVNPNLILNFL